MLLLQRFSPVAFIPTLIVQEDWKENTEYKGYTAKSDPVVWLWEIVDAMDADDKVSSGGCAC